MLGTTCARCATPSAGEFCNRCEGQVLCLHCQAAPVENANADFCSQSCRETFGEQFLKEFKDIIYPMRFWRRYVHLQNEFLEITHYTPLWDKYVSSDAISSLIVACGSEIDSICKALIMIKKRTNMYSSETNMTDWRGYLERHYRVSRIALLVPKLEGRPEDGGGYVRPFRQISSGMSWWKSYNNIKHNRLIAEGEATVGVGLECLGGLFILNIIMLQDVFDHWAQLRSTPVPYGREVFDNIDLLFYPRGPAIATTTEVVARLTKVALGV